MSWWYRWLWALVAAQRLREVGLSHRLEQGLAGTAAAPGSFPIMVATHIGLFLLPSLEARWAPARAPGAGLWATLLLAATALRWWSIRSLGTQWNVRAIVPEDLRPVTAGPYRWIRHPNYLAVIAEFWALPMAAGAWRSAIGLSLVNAAVLTDRIRSEEALLAAVPGYSEAFAARGRFIPGIF